MTAPLAFESAKIYQFTPRRRDNAEGSRGRGELVTLRPAPAPVAPAICFDSWYHEAAMREEAQARKG